MRLTQRFLVHVVVSLFILFVASGPLYAASFSFVVMADSRGSSTSANGVNDAVLSGFVSNITQTDARFILFPGDLVVGENKKSPPGALAAQLAHWRTIMAPIYTGNFYGAKVYASPGNHEIHDAMSTREVEAAREKVWQTVFSDLPSNGPTGETFMTYSFNFGNAHFVMLDTNRAGSHHTVNLAWLAADLAATKAEHIFVLGHEPAFPVNLHKGDSLDFLSDQRDAFWKLLAKYRVDIYFAGHEHLYNHQQVDGVHQVIAGTCGAPIYKGSGGEFYHYARVTVDGAKVSVDIIDNYQKLRDHFEYAKPTPLPATSWLPGAGMLCLAGGRWEPADKGQEAAWLKIPRPQTSPQQKYE